MHRFCERSPPEVASGGVKGAQDDDADPDADDVPSSGPRVLSQVEPDFLQLDFRLGEDDDEGFPKVVSGDNAPALS